MVAIQMPVFLSDLFSIRFIFIQLQKRPCLSLFFHQLVIKHLMKYKILVKTKISIVIPITTQTDHSDVTFEYPSTTLTNGQSEIKL